MYPDLSEKVAVITGAGRPNGLGEAMAKHLASEGCNVVITDVHTTNNAYLPASAIANCTEMERIVSQIKSDGNHASAFTCNVLNEEDIKATVDFAVKTYGQLDIWINNAGIGYLMNSIVNTHLDEWDTVIGVNLRGAFCGIKYAAKQMIKQGKGGKIINIGSQASKSAFAHASAYTSSKHALVGLTRTAAIELGPHNINVNCICPNHITTELGAWQNKHFSKIQGKDHTQYMKDMQEKIPLGRTGLQSDIAKACAFLVSEQSNYVTGECMNVSGGEEYH